MATLKYYDEASSQWLAVAKAKYWSGSAWALLDTSKTKYYDTASSSWKAINPAAPITDWQPLGELSVGGDMVSISISPYDSNRIIVAGDLLGLGLSNDGGNSWQSTTGLPSWQMAEQTWLSADTVWSGSMSGPVKSADGGSTWTSQRAGMPAVIQNQGDAYSAPTQKILQDPSDSSRLLAFFGSHRGWSNYASTNNYGQVWASTNSGASWSLLSTVNSQSNITGVTYTSDNSAILVSTYDAGIFRSSDDGSTWTQINSGLPSWNEAHYVVSDPTDASTAWTCYYDNPNDGTIGGIWKTSNVLAATPSWSQSSSQINDAHTAIEQMAISPDGNTLITGTVFFSNVGSGNSNTYKSTDKGDTWTMITTAGGVVPRASTYAEYTTFDPANSSKLFIVNQENILKSTNSGTSWTDSANIAITSTSWKGRGFSGYVSNHVSFGKQSGNILLSGDDGELCLLSNDDGASWSLPNFNTVGGGLPYFGTQGGGAFSSCFGGPNDQSIYVNTGMVFTFNGVLYSHDGGATMHYVAPGTNGLGAQNSGSNQDLNGIVCASSDGQTALLCHRDGLYRTTDGGASWSLGWSIGSGSSYTAAVAVDPSNYNTVWVSGYISGPSVYLSTDNGQTASQLSNSPNNITNLTIDPNDPSTVYATGWQMSDPYVTSNSGASWTVINGLPANCSQIVVDPTNSNRLAASTMAYPEDVCASNGVYISTDKGNSWTVTNDNLGVLRVMNLAFDPHHSDRLICSTYGRGSWEIKLG